MQQGKFPKCTAEIKCHRLMRKVWTCEAASQQQWHTLLQRWGLWAWMLISSTFHLQRADWHSDVSKQRQTANRSKGAEASVLNLVHAEKRWRDVHEEQRDRKESETGRLVSLRWRFDAYFVPSWGKSKASAWWQEEQYRYQQLLQSWWCHHDVSRTVAPLANPQSVLQTYRTPMVRSITADWVACAVGVWPSEAPDWLPPLTSPSNNRKHTCFEKTLVWGSISLSTVYRSFSCRELWPEVLHVGERGWKNVNHGAFG